MTPDNDSPGQVPFAQFPGQPGEPRAQLPARRRRTRPGGRHRGTGSFEVPADAPALILAVPGTPAPAGSLDEQAIAQTIAELAALTEAAHPGLSVRAAYAPDLAARLAEFVTPGPDGRPGPGAIVVPLITGPLLAFEEPVRLAVQSVRAAVPDPAIVLTVTEPLGPHPLIAQALHTRLTEAGLARLDRVRLLTMVTSADGVVVAVTGGAAAVRDAEVTCVLLASRLAVPVVPVALDFGDGIAAITDAADRLRGAGAVRVALAPCVIGPEAGHALRTLAAAESKTEIAAPIGAHPAIAQLIAERYATALERAWAESES